MKNENLFMKDRYRIGHIHWDVNTLPRNQCVKGNVIK